MDDMTVPAPLTDAQRRELRQALKQRYLELWDDVHSELASGAAESYQQTAGEVGDLEDDATADVIVDVNLAAVHRDIVEMRDVEAALERLTARTYGTCTECGADIGLERLRAYPTAKRCQPCQRRREARYAHEPTPSL